MGTLPDQGRLLAAVEATWPPAARVEQHGWIIRNGAGGGKRVSAASAARPGDMPDITAAEQAMATMGQVRLFQLTPEETALDTALADRGYAVVDPVVIYIAPAEALVGTASHLAAAYRCALRPAAMEEIWAAGGIGPARLAVMDRATGASAFLMSRTGDTPAGAAFLAVDRDIAMIHAIDVLSHLRRNGAGQLLMELAARMAIEAGARWLALAVTEANAPARALYARLGMVEAARYHYRLAKGDTP